MRRSKLIILVGINLALFSLIGGAADRDSKLSLDSNLGKDEALTKSLPDSDTSSTTWQPVQLVEKVERFDESEDGSLSELPAFSRSQVPSGRLLEAGAILHRNSILKNSSSAPTGLRRDSFNDSLDELFRANLQSLDPTSKGKRPNLYQISREYSKPGVYPLSLALLDYESLDETAILDAESFKRHFEAYRSAKIGKTNTFAASTVQAKVVYGRRVQLVLPRELIFVDANKKIDGVVFEFGGKKQSITIDQPFEVDLVTKEDIKRFQEGNNVRTEKIFTLYVTANGTQYISRGLFMWADPSTNVSARISGNSLLCFDMPQLTATQPYGNQFAKINLRIYPSQGSVSNLGLNDSGCNNGANPELKQVLIVVDGFDPGDNRTQESILEDFGLAIAQFVNSGFDVVAVDYENGRDYIQSNGYAVRELLVNQVPNWIASNGDDRVVVVAGSMGTQTSRYAMRSAELAGEEHNVDLWFAIDGPFRGANIPISLQAFVEFFSFSSSGKENLDGLNSPPASQQLLRNRQYNPNVKPKPRIFKSNEWYLPRQEFYSYYNEVIQMGLPQNSRNIGISSGSGNGRLQGPTATSGIAKSQFLSLDHETFPWVIIRTLAQSDHAGEVFYGRYKVPRYLCRWPFNSADFCANWTARLILNYPARLDLAPGGFRTSATDIAEEWNEEDDRGTMYSPFETHNFIPTASALNIPLGSPFYQPHYDSSAFSTSGFDRIWYESCNVKHAEQTPGMWSVVQQELYFFLQSSTPSVFQPPMVIPNCDEEVPTANYWIQSISVAEEGQEIEVIVRRSPAAPSNETVRTIVVGGTATANQDYTSNDIGIYSGSIPSGNDTATIRIQTLSDNLNEGTESVEIKLFSTSYSDAGFPAILSQDIHVGYIDDSDPNTIEITATCYANFVGMIDGPDGTTFPHYQMIGDASSVNGTIVERRIKINSSPFGPWVASSGNSVLLTDLYPGGPGQANDYFVIAQFRDSLGNVAEASCSASYL